jgi:glycosyl-4,4'-diaponeurosporenoate acyltransferase
VPALPLLVELPDGLTVLLNVAAWAGFHAGSGYAVHRLPRRRLAHDGWLLRPRAFERGGRSYERLHVRGWKERLPEAGALFHGGTSKRHLPGHRGREGLERFIIETRRAEWGHWSAMACGPLAALWNPPLGAALMVAYGVVVNLPFIIVQRYNRQRAQRVLSRRAARPPAADRAWSAQETERSSGSRPRPRLGAVRTPSGRSMP